VTTHPFESDVWKALGDFDLDFASEARNIQIGLAIDAFTPFIMVVSSYSCCPVIAISARLRNIAPCAPISSSHQFPWASPGYRDVNGDPIPANPWEIPLLGYGYGTKIVPMGMDMGQNLHPLGKRVWVWEAII
jgi:hypothetical protein